MAILSGTVLGLSALAGLLSFVFRPRSRTIRAVGLVALFLGIGLTFAPSVG